MKKHAKIIGSLGLAAAVSMGAFAALPASAVDTNLASPATADVTVSLTVESINPTVLFNRPLDDENFVGSEVPVKLYYKDLFRLKYILTHVAEDGTKTPYEVANKTLATEGVAAHPEHDDDPLTVYDEFTIDINNFGGQYGSYILEAIGNDNASIKDSVSFNIVAFDFVPKTTEPETNNPVLKTLESPGTKFAKFQAFDKGNNPVFPTPIRVEVDSNGETDFVLPFKENNAPSGKYRVVGYPYDKSGNPIDDVKERYVDYVQPEGEPEPAPEPVPDVPDTGSFFGGLSLTQTDIIGTGLAILFVCSFFGIMIIAKRSKKDSRR